MDASFDLGMEEFFGGQVQAEPEQNKTVQEVKTKTPVNRVMVEEPRDEEELVEVMPKEPQFEAKPSTKKKVEKRIEEDVKASIEATGKPDYETTVSLPSKGILYNGLIPSDITLRGMTTKDEKILYTSTGNNTFQRILNNCIVQPRGLDTRKLIAADELFLVLQLRMITYGPEYKVDVQCPECGEISTYTLNLGELNINYLDDDFKEPIMVKLPRSGDTVGLRILRNEDVEFIDRYAKKFAKQFNLNYREVEYECRLAKYIETINGQKVDFGQAKAYVENMMSRDSAQIRSVLSKIVVGVDTSVTETCKSCGEEFSFVMPLTSEFFRPTFE